MCKTPHRRDWTGLEYHAISRAVAKAVTAFKEMPRREVDRADIITYMNVIPRWFAPPFLARVARTLIIYRNITVL